MSKNGQKTVIFVPKIMLCEILTKILCKNCQTIQGHYFNPKTTLNHKHHKKPIKTVCLAVKTKVLCGFSGSEPRNGMKTEKLVKTDVNIRQQKILHGQTRLDEASLAMPYTVKYLVNLADCYSQIRKFDCFGRLIARFDQVTDRFWILTCLTQTNLNPKLRVCLNDSERFRKKTLILANFVPNREKKIALLTTHRSGHENTQIRSASQYTPQVPQENIPKKACLQSMQANQGFPIQKPRKTEKYVFQDRKFMS